jgi:hypothetical protein
MERRRTLGGKKTAGNDDLLEGLVEEVGFAEAGDERGDGDSRGSRRGSGVESGDEGGKVGAGGEVGGVEDIGSG